MVYTSGADTHAESCRVIFQVSCRLQQTSDKNSEAIHGENKSIVYTRWGKKSCPPNAELVYSGFLGGSSHAHSGSAVDSLCLPRYPQWGIHGDGTNTARACVYGTYYEIYSFSYHIDKHVNQDVPCAMCLRSASKDDLLQRLVI